MRYRRLAENEPEYNYGDGSLNGLPGGYSHVAVNGSTNIRGSGGNYVNKPGEGTANWCGFKYYTGKNNKTMADVGLDAFWEAEICMQSGLIERFKENGFDDERYLGHHYNNRTFSPIRDKITILNQFTSPLPDKNSVPTIRGGKLVKGENVCAFNHPIRGEKTVYFKIHWAAHSVKIGNVEFLHNGEYYSLKELVEMRIIKPLVLIGTEDPGLSGTQCADALRLYDGSPSNRIESTAAMISLFMTNDGANITGCRFTTDKDFDSCSDCWMCAMTDIRNFRITLENFNGLEIMTPNLLATAFEPLRTDVKLTAGGNRGKCTFEIVSGKLPAGLTLEDGIISGIPLVAGTFTIKIKATDEEGNTAEKQIKITVSKYKLKFAATDNKHVYDNEPHTVVLTPTNVPDVPGMPEEALQFVQGADYKPIFGKGVNTSTYTETFVKGTNGWNTTVRVIISNALSKYYDASEWTGSASILPSEDYTFNVSDKTVNYNGEPQAVVPEIYSNFAQDDEIKFQVYYTGVNGTKYRQQTTPPTAVGTYTARVKVNDTLYAEQEKTVTLTITE